MKTAVKLWIGLSVLWVALIFIWLSFTPPDDHDMAALFPVVGMGPVLLSGALVGIFGWAFKRS